jgi:Uma2 family endonuclease
MSTIEIAPPLLEYPVPTRIGPEHNGMPMTPEEFDAIEDWDDDFRYELVRGVLIVSPPADIGELKPNDELGYWFLSYRDHHAKDSALDDTVFEFTLKTTNGRRRAGRVVWCGLERFPNYRNDVPAIAIEFVAERARNWRRDHIEKRAEYAEIGVKEYWVIDRFRRIITVYRGAAEERIVKETEVYTTDLLPGFELNLKRLLEIADRASKNS